MSNNPLGQGMLGQSRLGDGSTSARRGYTQALAVTYRASGSKYAAALGVTYRAQKANTAPLLVFYTAIPLSVFSINGDATIVAPDQVTYTPRPVAARTLFGQPLLQGYRTMTWTYSELRQAEWKYLVSFYNPASPQVLVTYLDEHGIWVQRQVEMLPPTYGTQQTVEVQGAQLSFTGLL